MESSYKLEGVAIRVRLTLRTVPSHTRVVGSSHLIIVDNTEYVRSLIQRRRGIESMAAVAQR